MAQIGTIEIPTQNNGTVQVPVFDVGDSGSDVYEMVRVPTSGGVGFIPAVAPTDANFPYLRVPTQNNGVLAIHNETTLTNSYTGGYIDDFEGDWSPNMGYDNIVGWIGDTGSFSQSSEYAIEGSSSGHLIGVADNFREVQFEPDNTLNFDNIFSEVLIEDNFSGSQDFVNHRITTSNSEQVQMRFDPDGDGVLVANGQQQNFTWATGVWYEVNVDIGGDQVIITERGDDNEQYTITNVGFTTSTMSYVDLQVRTFDSNIQVDVFIDDIYGVLQ